MKALGFISVLLPPLASAFPAMMGGGIALRDPAPTKTIPFGLEKRADNATQQISMAETNCGPRAPCLIFDAAEQRVSTTGQYAYQSPSAADIRGPCPGLNAAANHGYLPRNGIASIPQTILGLGQAYGMEADLAGFLAAYAIVMDGDPVTQVWSIGGPLPAPLQLTGYPPQGISYSHNKYEGDTSICRPDAYLNNGDAHSLDLSKFARVFDLRGKEDRLTADKFRQYNAEIQYEAIRNNPYYFAPLFSTTLVAPAAHNFVINFMSNHSAQEPSGYLNGDIFKQFFGVTGDSSENFKWIKGQERIPDNWYRRPSSNQYGDSEVFLDLAIGWAAYPNTFRFGGNTNGVNSYQGVDIASLTGGSYNYSNVFEGNNFACLLFQTQQQAVPDELKGLVNDLDEAVALYSKYADPLLAKLNCKPLSKYDAGPLTPYPGRDYNPRGPDNNY